MSTMDEECWGLIAEIISLNPSICLSAFRDLGGLGQKQSLDLLRKLENKEIKLSELKRLAKEMEPSPTEPLTFQRLREQKVR